MLERITRKVKQGAVEDVKRTVKQEAAKCANDLLPTVVGIAFVALLFLACVPPQKLAPSTVTINNFYFRR